MQRFKHSVAKMIEKFESAIAFTALIQIAI
jgi:hypothetical protein